MKIMIVEDEDNIREGLVSLLDWKKAGFDPPVLFGGAIEALEYLETEKVDVVLTDDTEGEPDLRHHHSDRA